MENAEKILGQLEALRAAKVVKDFRQSRALGMAIDHFKKLAEEEKKTILNMNLKVVVMDEDIDDIMCAALEGGVNYWCDGAEVDGEYIGEYASEQISRGGVLLLHDQEADRQCVLSKKNFLIGLEMYLRRPFGSRILTSINRELRVDVCNVDAVVADSIIQLAVFGDEVYG